MTVLRGDDVPARRASLFSIFQGFEGQKQSQMLCKTG